MPRMINNDASNVNGFFNQPTNGSNPTTSYDYINNVLKGYDKKNPLCNKNITIAEKVFVYAMQLPQKMFSEVFNSFNYLYSKYQSWSMRTYTVILKELYRMHLKYQGNIQRRLKPLAIWAGCSVSHLKRILRELRECNLIVRLAKGGRTNASTHIFTKLGLKLANALINGHNFYKRSKKHDMILHKKPLYRSSKFDINTPQSPPIAMDAPAQPTPPPPEGRAKEALGHIRALLEPTSG